MDPLTWRLIKLYTWIFDYNGENKLEKGKLCNNNKPLKNLNVPAEVLLPLLLDFEGFSAFSSLGLLEQ